MMDVYEIRNTLKKPLFTRWQSAILIIMTVLVVYILATDLYFLYFEVRNDTQAKTISLTGFINPTSSPISSPTQIQPSQIDPGQQEPTEILLTATLIPSLLKYPTFTIIPSPTIFEITPRPTTFLLPTP